MEEKILLDKPDFSSLDKASLFQKMEDTEASVISNYITSVTEPQYLFWDKVQYKNPPPEFNALEGWYLVKQFRKFSSKPTLILSENNLPFYFNRRNSDDEHLHRIDMLLGGHLITPHSSVVEENRQKFLRRGLVEEAIASSQLEGAATTRSVAKQMILEQREPRNHSEVMIINNYRAMQLLEEDYAQRPLSIDLLFELHRVLTKDDNEIAVDERGRFRRNEDEIIVTNRSKNKVAHVPPNEDFLKREINRLISYANDEDGNFTHPIIKAILLHFWFGYLHPFTDGNGRTARAIFYWYLLRRGYPSILYFPISTVIKKSPTQYAQAFIYSEQDDNDLTYFVDYHLRKILQAIEEFEQHIDKILEKNKKIDALVKKDAELNDRQKQVLHFLLSEARDAYTTVQTHMAANGISRITAQKDLKELEALGYLASKKVSTFRRYLITNKLTHGDQDSSE